MMGFTAPQIFDRVLEGSTAVEEHEAKELFSQSMNIAHIAAILVAVLVEIEGLFAPAGSGG